MLTGLFGCGGRDAKEEAHTTVSAFFTRLTEGNVDGALALTYPALGVQSASFKNYITEVERECGITFTDGRSNMRVGVSEDIGDGDYLVGGEINIGEVRISFEMVVRSDGGGAGIFSMLIGEVRF